MAEPICSEGSFVGGKIVTEMPVSEISEAVMAGNIFVLKGLFSAVADELVALRRAVFEWGQKTEPMAEPDAQANCHCMQAGVSRLQKTPHVYHSYNFNRISRLPPELSAQLFKYFAPLCEFQNTLTGNSARLEGFEDGATLHPQVIQYPLGGGIFGRHRHPLVPQKIGLIVSLSARGLDYSAGGACFETADGVVNLEPYHELGDMALFRFDIPHWVNPSTLQDNFDWDSEAGRWTMVLPYY
ncbi:MAG TPA: hypothetical protein VGB17_17605 [Pyrinomonadaceae bacterium]